jgi:hypothetical protein
MWEIQTTTRFILMPGGGEDYTYWMRAGKADTVLNYYIEHGIAVPMILVTPDGRNLSPEIFSNEMLNDIIPYVESNYRVKADKDPGVWADFHGEELSRSKQQFYITICWIYSHYEFRIFYSGKFG